MVPQYSVIKTVENCPNFWEGRDSQVVKGIVIHKPEGENAVIIPYLMESATQKSYHYLIAYDGTITQLVDPANSAWHCGGPQGATWPGLIPDVNPNYYTIGIALEGFAAQPHTEAQFKSLYKLVADCCLYAGLAVTADTIVFHKEINDQKTCPGLILNKEVVILTAECLVAAGNVVGWPPETAAS